MAQIGLDPNQQMISMGYLPAFDLIILSTTVQNVYLSLKAQTFVNVTDPLLKHSQYTEIQTSKENNLLLGYNEFTGKLQVIRFDG